MKAWGTREYWGCGSEFDPDWMLTCEQLELRDKLVELCRTTIRPKAAAVDRDYVYPRESLEALASLNLLGLLVPKALGGLGENHVCAAMVTETIARYGCPSTALCYTMHLTATSCSLWQYEKNPAAVKLLKDIIAKKLMGTIAISDPETGGHFWFALTSKSKFVSENMMRILKYGSWCTSAGYADFYIVSTASPSIKGDSSDISLVLCFKNEIRGFAGDWEAMGMHGNMSGEIVVDCELPADRIIGKPGDFKLVLYESGVPIFNSCASACWNGIAMACMDLAKKHVTRNAHGDVGMRVCDYPVIQDYFGSSLCSTSAARLMNFSCSQELDRRSNNNDWSSEVTEKMPRVQLQFWALQVKVVSAENALRVSDMMLKACGGTGYKVELGLERLLRDARAGVVMGPSVEVARSILGRVLLIGEESLDLWNQVPNKRVLAQELSKMSLDEKEKLFNALKDDIELEKNPPEKENLYPDFDNPFHTCPVRYIGEERQGDDPQSYALHPDRWTRLSLVSRKDLSSSSAAFCFALPEGATHTGLLPGQYVQVRVETETDGHQTRYMSPVSRPDDAGGLELVLRYASHGVLSERFRTLRPGDSIECRGPCGGFEYSGASAAELTLLASGGGVTPALQLLRTILAADPPRPKLKLIFYSESYDHVLYRDELDRYAATKKNFEVVYTLGEVPEQWEGEEGFIDTEKLDKYVTKDTSDEHKILICGGPSMSLSCCHGLRSLGFRSSQIFVFGQFGGEQVRRVYGRNAPLSSHTC